MLCSQCCFGGDSIPDIGELREDDGLRLGSTYVADYRRSVSIDRVPSSRARDDLRP